jgi:ribonuclease HII
MILGNYSCNKMEECQNKLVYELNARAQGFKIIAGIDEAGRGPLAGPVVAACVILPDDINGLEGLDDSKKLGTVCRKNYYQIILKKAYDVGIGVVDAVTVDRLNILQATFLAMKKAVDHLSLSPDFLLIDGNQRPKWAEKAETIVKGDQKSLSIAAASIIAKVTRDQIMIDLDPIYPGWGFAKHKGYGTAEHIDAIEKLGICDLHRHSFSPIMQLGLIGKVN